jgi:hypothetical protein
MGDMAEHDEFDDANEEPAVDKSEATSAALAGFFKEVEQLKGSMEEISENISAIKSLYSELLTATSTEQGKGTLLLRDDLSHRLV